MSHLLQVFNNLCDIDVHRTLGNTPSTADTAFQVIAVQVIFQLVHEAVANPLFLGRAGIVPPCHECKVREHAGIPATETVSGNLSGYVIKDIKAVTGRADKGADAATETLLEDLVPVWQLKVLIENLLYPLQVHLSRKLTL